MIARRIYSGFEEAHDTYCALSVGSDEKIYYVLSSEDVKIGGHFYVYDPKANKTELIGDLTELCGEKNINVIGQGKSHVPFFEMDGKLFFSTHVGIYESVEGRDQLPGNSIDGYEIYSGGHFLSYDLETKEINDLAIAPYGEGIVSMTMDCHRGQIYAITWPTGYFLHFDILSKKLNNIGNLFKKGERGLPGRDFRTLCRSLVVDPRDGKVYFSDAESDINYYDPKLSTLGKKERANLRKDYFGYYDPTMPGDMAYNWRRAVWYEKENTILGVHGNSGYLFRFSPDEDNLELVRRMTSLPSQILGMYDQFSYGYLGFDLDPLEEVIYYLTGGPVFINGQRIDGVKRISKGASRGLENIHLITYHISSDRYFDYGAIFYEDGTRPTYVNSIAISRDRVFPWQNDPFWQ